MAYRDIYKKLNLGILAEQCAFADVELPVYFIAQNPQPYGFLPALLPIWREDTDVIGYWKHWFSSKRHLTIVQQAPEFSFETEEIARDFKQLLFATLFRKAAVWEEFSSNDLELAHSLGFDLVELRNQYEKDGDDPINFLKIKAFANNPPLICEPTEYNGDFPCPLINLSADYLHNTCTVEFNDELKQIVRDLAFCPPWFKVAEQAPLFYDLLKKKDFSGAWMTLNSNGWEFSDAKKALLALANEVNNDTFTLLATTRAAQPHEQYGTY